MGYKNIEFEKDSVFLVTGGAGFIGSNLCESILKKGYAVRCLDNLSCGKIQNIEPFMSDPKFTFIKGDIGDPETCLKACAGAHYVIHHAALASVPQSMEMPLLYEQVNVKGTLNMMEAAYRGKARKFVYASSSAVYGEVIRQPVKEGDEEEVLSPYGLTKKMDEELGSLYKRLYGLDTYGLRYFNVFGKRQDPGGAYAAVIPKFISLLLKGERPVINGDGTQTRDFTFVDNIVEANLRACKADSSVAGQVFNIAYGISERLIDIYDIICAKLGKDIKPVFGPERKGDIKFSGADILKAKKLLGFDPDYDFESGLSLAIGWYKANLI
jgi:UDP-N-acetylglucosamine/UDP-N-acetylgalactosamine 4-epimerase